LQAATTDFRSQHDALDSHLRTLAAADQFSGTVGVFSDQRPLFHQAYGFSNRADFVPNDVSTRYSTASLTGMFTAVAVAQLAEQGLLKFNHPVRDHLPSIAKRLPGKITIHHLLTHTSGLADYFQDDLPQATTAADLWSRFPPHMLRRPADFLPLILGKPLRAEPGTTFSYCAAGYILLGLVIEQLTGLSYFDYIATHIFQRAGMDDSGFFALDHPTPRRAMGYIPPAFTTNIYSLPPSASPDSGACCTAADIARFLASLKYLHLLSEPFARSLLEEHVPLDESQSYGYGFWLKHLSDSRQIIGHSAEEPGSSCRAYRLSDPEFTVIVLSNFSNSAGPVFEDILQRLA
jgi:CubicO group peptidase (beta-lactamase class C family)